MIQMQNMSFQYKPALPVLENISVDFKAGHVYGLLGLNGAGKTTLMKIAAGVRFPKKGSCKTMGFESKNRKREMLEDLYLLTQEFRIQGKHRIIDIVLNEIAPFYPRFSMDNFHEYMRRFGVVEKLPINKLSFGEMRIVEICCAMAAGTRLLLLDEPTNGLDIPSRDIFRTIASSRCCDDCCMIISTHQIKDVEKLVDSVAILHDHKILLCDDLFQLSTRIGVSLETTEPTRDSLIYKEKAIGGWITMKAVNNPMGESLDLEVLFKAIISEPDKLADAIKGGKI